MRQGRRSRGGACIGALTLALGCGAFATTTTPARAQGGEGAVAEALFRSARSLAASGDYAHACPKFAESERIDPKLGTLMNLALCHEKEGKTASAWAEYTQAAELASRAGQGERERVARTSAAAMEKVLPHLVLQPATHDPIVVTLDGQTMGAATLGIPLPVDPGVHQVGATADGRRAFSQSVTIAPGPQDRTVTIPALEVLAQAIAAATPTPSVATSGAPPATAPSEVPYGHRVLGYALIGGGAAAIIVGGVFGGLAFSNKSAAEGQCSAAFCTQAGLSDISAMRASEAVSTLGVGVGLALAAAGVYFVIRSGTRKESLGAPSPSARLDPILGPGQGGVALSGAF